MKILPFKTSGVAEIGEGEVVAYISAVLRKDGVVVTDAKGETLQLAGLLGFLDVEVKSFIEP